MSRKSPGLLVVLCATLLYLPAVHGQQSEGRAGKWVLLGGLNYGIEETVDDDGDTYRIGDGLYVGGGYEFTNSTPWATRLTIGYLANEGEVGDTDNEFSVWPLEVLMLYRFGITRLGLGLGWNIEPVYKAEIDDEKFEIELDSDFSLTAAFEVDPVPFFSLGVRYTWVEYDIDGRFVLPDEQTEEQLDASSIGGYAIFKF